MRAARLEGSLTLIATRERCQMCHHVNAIGFHVPNAVWLAAVHRHWQNSILCLSCFVSQADEKLIAWDEGIVFYPVSLRTHLGDRFADQPSRE
jgi:hypothetical protein